MQPVVCVCVDRGVQPAVCVWACLPCRLGYKVALIDADVGLRNLDLLLGLENRVLYTAIDILEGDCRCDNSTTPCAAARTGAASSRPAAAPLRNTHHTWLCSSRREGEQATVGVGQVGAVCVLSVTADGGMLRVCVPWVPLTAAGAVGCLCCWLPPGWIRPSSVTSAGRTSACYPSAGTGSGEWRHTRADAGGHGGRGLLGLVAPTQRRVLCTLRSQAPNSIGLGVCQANPPSSGNAVHTSTAAA